MELREFTNALIRMICETQIHEIPQFVPDALLNYLAVTMKGSAERSTDILASYAAMEGQGNYSPLGRNEHLSASMCALTDCFSSAILAFDDIHFATTTHPCGPVAAAMLACARKNDFTLKEILEALLIGMEAECRCATLMFLHESKGWYTTGIAGGIGAAAGIGRLLKFDPETMKNAIALASAYACGIRGTHGSMSGSYIPAIAAKNGYEAAMLAEKGFTCSLNAFDGANGLVYQITDHPCISEAMEGIGSVFASAETSCKPYAYGFISYGIIGALSQMPHIENIREMRLHVSKRAALLGRNPYPQTMYQGFVSLPYIAAKAMVSIDSLQDPLSEQLMLSEEDKKRIDLVTIIPEENMPDEEALIEVITENDTVILHCDEPLGSYNRKMTHEEILKKVRHLCTLDETLIDQLADAEAHYDRTVCFTSASDQHCSFTLSSESH